MMRGLQFSNSPFLYVIRSTSEPDVKDLRNGEERVEQVSRSDKESSTSESDVNLMTYKKGELGHHHHQRFHDVSYSA